MNFYPIWNSATHGPACSASELAELYADAIGNVPCDVIHFVDEENLVARLRMLGWTAIADIIAPAKPLSPEDEEFLRSLRLFGWTDTVDKEFSQ